MSTEKQPRKMPLPWDALAIILAVTLFGAGHYVYSRVQHARELRSAPPAENPVVLTVNGEPIYQKEIDHGLPVGTFSDTAGDMRENKIERLIILKSEKQFLAKHGISVSENAVDVEVVKLENNPPSQGCACCNYPTLDLYLSSVGYTRRELRQQIRNDLGLRQYVRTSWKESHPRKEDTLREIGAESEFIKTRYVNAWHIFINTFQQPEFAANPDKVRASVKARAEKAWKRLQNGDNFPRVASDVSEDMNSRKKGGALGYIDRSSYGREFERMISQIKPGEISKPVESPWGYHIIKWQPMSEDDIIEFCESYLMDRELQKVRDRISKETVVKRLDAS